ncbi:hypothetical protein ACWA5Z_05905 [Testudinibacter sp. P80/BLE/0925]|uniref:hypothetical protein n=1 Tax=Testudinibacter sp. TW-1 TaxID=3417757 RepID=UPI003D361125
MIFCINKPAKPIRAPITALKKSITICSTIFKSGILLYPVIIANTEDYLDVIPMQETHIAQGEPLISIVLNKA